MLALSPAAAAESAGDLRRRNNEIIVGMPAVPAVLDPVKALRASDFMLIQAVFVTLVFESESGRLVGDLAQRWEIDESGTRYTFHLDPKAAFSSGGAVTASDVAWSLSRHYWPGANSAVASYIGVALDIPAPLREGEIPSCFRVVDDRTIQIKLTKPYPAFLYALSRSGFSVTPKGFNDFGSPVGSGPMTARYDAKASSWLLKANPSYRGSKPKMSEMRVVPLHGLAATAAALKAGAVDLVLSMPLGEAAEVALPPTHELLTSDSLAFAHLYHNMERPAFRDPVLRKDFGLLVQTILKGAKASPFHERQPHFLPRGLVPNDYYKRETSEVSPELFRRRWSGKIPSAPIDIALRSATFTADMVAHLEIGLHAAGFTPKIRLLETPEYGKARSGGDFDLISGAYIGVFADPDGFIDPFRKTSPLRSGRLPTDALLNRLNQARHLQDPARRLGLYAEALRAFEEEWYLIPLYRLRLPIIKDRRIAVPDTAFRFEGDLWNIAWQK